MKVLIVTQYFFPENFKSNDMAFELVKRGYDVSVLTGYPNYPEGKIFSGYGFFKNRFEVIEGVKVYRSLLLPRGKGGGLRLFLNYFSWAFFASIRAFFMALFTSYDAIIVHEPSPITQGIPAIVVRKLQRIPIYFWVLDLWPESLASAGGVKNKQVLGFFTGLVKMVYNNSDKILISSKGFEKSILEKGDYKDKLIYFPNWAEDTISEGKTDYEIPKLPDGFRVLFAGNIGASQDMENVMLAAKHLKDHKNIKFVLVGDGRSKSFVEEYVKKEGLEDTVILTGKYPVEAMATFFNQADALLVSLKDELIFNLTVPAKVQAYMSSSKPILAMLNGEGAAIINEARCGYAVPSGDHSMLSQYILKLSEQTNQERIEMGKSGKRFYKQNFELQNCMNNLENILNKKI